MKIITLICFFLAWQTAWATTLSVDDDLGEKVVLNKIAQRIIATSPHAAELVVAAGAEDKLVGVSIGSDYPERLEKIPRIGNFSGLDREHILKLNPDIAIVWASGNKPNDIQWLKSQNIAVYQSEPKTLDSIAKSLSRLGKLFGTKILADTAAASFRDQLETTSCTNKIKPVFFSLWDKPSMTLGANHWLNEVLAKAGLINVFSDENHSVFAVEYEAFYSKNPELTVSTELHRPKTPYAVPHVTAPRFISRPGPRIPEAIKILCNRKQQSYSSASDS